MLMDELELIMELLLMLLDLVPIYHMILILMSYEVM